MRYKSRHKRRISRRRPKKPSTAKRLKRYQVDRGGIRL